MTGPGGLGRAGEWDRCRLWLHLGRGETGDIWPLSNGGGRVVHVKRPLLRMDLNDLSGAKIEEKLGAFSAYPDTQISLAYSLESLLEF